jgi:hypothetical protein
MVNLTTAAVKTIAGSTTPGFVDGDSATSRFNTISDLDVDEQGNLWVADVGNHAIRYVMRTPHNGNGSIIDYVVNTIAGNGTIGVDDGSGTYATFNNVVDVSCDMKGNAFVTDQGAVNLRKISWVLPITMNAPRLGSRLDSMYDANYYTFTNTESKRVVIEVDTNRRCNNVNLQLFGPNDDYNLVASDMNGKNARFDNTLAAGKYLIRITTNRTTTQRPGAYTVRVHDGRDLLTSGTQAGNIQYEGDNDWYSFNVTSAGTGSHTISATSISSSLSDSVHLYLYAKNWHQDANLLGRVLPDTLLAEGVNSITRTLDSRFYWVRVRGCYDNITSEFLTGTYSINAIKNP